MFLLGDEPQLNIAGASAANGQSHGGRNPVLDVVSITHSTLAIAPQEDENIPLSSLDFLA